ncbi:RNA polymerase sigma factor [Paracidovorax oryzae]|uniref:RNA polymerase sigma factor n=1 Tax=Paracidovorax oryzae TaxID=862720 RepID=UPI00068F4800|nr:sigma-70 family RNA polymerase sigma factor [Paracidovorax oryzae]
MVTRHYRELLNFLARAVRDRDTARDLVQESYARVLAVQHSGKAIGDARALLYRTARNLVIDRHRRAEVRAGKSASSGAESEADPMAVLEGIAAPVACEPEVAAASAETVQALLAAIGALPLRCREAFILHKFDGLSQAEVANRMDISVKMVERHIQRAMEACRLCLRRMDGAAEDAPE